MSGSPPDVEKLLEEKEEALRTALANLRENELRIAVLESENLRLKAEMDAIRTSLTWRLVTGAHFALVERMLPRGTRGRHWYDRVFHRASRLLDRSRKPSLSALPLDRLVRSEGELELQRTAGFPYMPRITVVAHAEEIPQEGMAALVESLQAQTYPHWDLHVIGGHAPLVELQKELERIADRRVLPVPASGPGDSQQECLPESSGEFVALVAGSGKLLPDALFEVVKTLNERPDAELIYSDYAATDDADRVSETGFCPDFCRYYYLSYPYIRHWVVLKKRIIDIVGAGGTTCFAGRNLFEGGLLLRALAVLDDNQIAHIPRILFVEGPSRRHASNTEEDWKLRKQEIQRYLDTRKMDGWVEKGHTEDTSRVRFRVKGDDAVSIVIPTKDRWELLKRCLASIEEKSGYRPYEVLIVSNNTVSRKARQYLESLKTKYKVLDYPAPFNYSAINNHAARLAKGDLLLFLNDDIEFRDHDTLRAAVELLQPPDVGIVGAKLLYPNETIQHAGVIIGLREAAEHWLRFEPAFTGKGTPERGYLSSLVSIREFSAVTGAFLITRRSVFEEMGGFREELKVGFNDIDLCLRLLSAGYRVLFTPFAVAYHHESASKSDYRTHEVLNHPDDRERFIQQWGRILAKGDRCYNPNLDRYSVLSTRR